MLPVLLFCAPSHLLGISFEPNNFNAQSLWEPNVVGSGPQLINTGESGFQAFLPAHSAQNGANTILAEYQSAYMIQGDFDVQVAYEMLAWPPSNGARLGISIAEWYGGARVSQVFAGSPPGNEAYVFGSGGVTSVIPTGDTSGKLRLTRTGTTFSGYFWDSSLGWVLLGSGVTPIEEFQLRIGAWSDDNFWNEQDVIVAFSSIRITAEDVIWGNSVAVPEVSSTLLLFGLALSALVWVHRHQR